MKKIILLTTILLGLNTINLAQDSEAKNFRFGLKGDMSFNWLNPENKRELLNGGVGVGYAWGLQLEFKITNNISFVSGLNMLSAGYKLNYKDGTSAGETRYVLDRNEDFVNISENTNGAYDTTNQTLYTLQNRTLRGNYINIPLSLKMKTNEIGYMTYFGEFGMNLNILTKGKVSKDEGITTPVGGAQTGYIREDLNLTKSMGLVNVGFRIGGGAEYNFSGTTSLFFALHYNHYFLNAIRTKDDFMQKQDLLITDKVEYKSAGQKAVPGAISLTVGVLF
jgi:hypothetical protein